VYIALRRLEHKRLVSTWMGDPLPERGGKSRRCVKVTRTGLQGGRVALLGVGAGILVALGVTGVLKSLLFGVSAFDAVTFMAMSGVMLAVAMLASCIPAHRASSVDPMQALRAD
jgi:hypothetical protein